MAFVNPCTRKHCRGDGSRVRGTMKAVLAQLRGAIQLPLITKANPCTRKHCRGDGLSSPCAGAIALRCTFCLTRQQSRERDLSQLYAKTGKAAQHKRERAHVPQRLAVTAPYWQNRS